MRSKQATIDPSFSLFASAIRSRMSSRVRSSFASSAFLIISSPQQCLACFRMLLVDPLSAVSRNRLTIRRSDPFPLQTGAEQVNSWHRQPFTTEILGVGLKNAYIGEPHVWESRSGEVGQIVSELFYWFNIPSSFSGVSGDSSTISISESSLAFFLWLEGLFLFFFWVRVPSEPSWIFFCGWIELGSGSTSE